VTPLPAWAELIAGFVETFGPGVRVLNVRLPTVPGWQLGVSVEEIIRAKGLIAETYEHNMGGFGPPVEDRAEQALPQGWKRRGDSGVAP
jgi:hypothetical protein